MFCFFSVSENPPGASGYELCGQHFQQRMDQPGMVANPARDQLNREKYFFSCPRLRLRIWTRETGLAILSRVSPLIININLVLTYGIRPAFRDGVHVYRHPPSGHAIAYRRRSRPRVRRHRANSPQGSSSNGCCPFQVSLLWPNFV